MSEVHLLIITRNISAQWVEDICYYIPHTSLQLISGRNANLLGNVISGNTAITHIFIDSGFSEFETILPRLRQAFPDAYIVVVCWFPIWVRRIVGNATNLYLKRLSQSYHYSLSSILKRLGF